MKVILQNPILRKLTHTYASTIESCPFKNTLKITWFIIKLVSIDSAAYKVTQESMITVQHKGSLSLKLQHIQKSLLQKSDPYLTKKLKKSYVQQHNRTDIP